MFRAFSWHKKMSSAHIGRYALLSGHDLLYALNSKPKERPNSQDFELALHDLNRFHQLVKGIEAVRIAVRALKARRRRGRGTVEEGEEEIEE